MNAERDPKTSFRSDPRATYPPTDSPLVRALPALLASLLVAGVARADSATTAKAPAALNATMERVARDQKEVLCLTTDATHVYFVTMGEQALWSVSKGGGEPVRLDTDHPMTFRVCGVAVDDAFVYWVRPGRERNTYRIARVAKQGGPAAVVADEMEGLKAIAVDGRRLIVSQDVFSPSLPVTRRGVIAALPTSGGARSTLARVREAPVEMVVAGPFLYWVDSEETGAPGCTNMFGVGENENCVRRTLVRVPKGGGVPKSLGRALGAPVSDGSALFMLHDGILSRFGHAAGACTLPVPIHSRLVPPDAAAVDATSCYLTDRSDIVRVPRQDRRRPESPH